MNTEQNNKESTGKQVEKEILNGTGTAAGEDTREEIREEKNPIQVAGPAVSHDGNAGTEGTDGAD